MTLSWLEDKVDVEVLTFYEGWTVIGSANNGRVTGMGLTDTFVYWRIGIAGSTSTTFPAVG